MNALTAPLRPVPIPMGRPTRAHAVLRHAELLDGALKMFLENGFELTTMEGVAATTGITKRTIYRRYDDKKALFLAAVQRAMDRWITPIGVFRAAQTDDLEATLLAVARMRAANIMSPEGLLLQRIIYTEAFRFPEIAARYDALLHPTIDYLTDLFARHEAKGLGVAGDPRMKALAFLSIVGVPTRAAILGLPSDPAEIDATIRNCVHLLLHGVCLPDKTATAA